MRRPPSPRGGRGLLLRRAPPPLPLGGGGAGGAGGGARARSSAKTQRSQANHAIAALASFSLSIQSRFAAAPSRAAMDGSLTLRLTKYSPVVFSTSGEDAR